MITLLLTSSPCIEGTPEINHKNGFKRLLLLNSHKRMSCTYITATPDDYHENDGHVSAFRDMLERIGFTFRQFRGLDRRNILRARDIVLDSDMLILGGGHVPTQNRFFMEMGLADILKDFSGMIVGISAGSMNSATEVYSVPEEPGEALDISYKRFFPGLGLTDVQIKPHMNKCRHATLDGLRIYEDISIPDSVGHKFYALPDGSFYFQQGDVREFHGETWILQNGEMRQICNDGEVVDYDTFVPTLNSLQ